MKRITYIIIVFLLSCNTIENPKQVSTSENSIEKEILTPLAQPFNNDTIFLNYLWKGDSSTYYWHFIDEKNNQLNNRLDTFVNQWFSHFMYEFNLNNLSKRYLGNEIYRLIWLRTFHNPIIIEINKNKTEITLNYKISDGAGGYEFGQEIIDTTFSIQEKNWDVLQDLILKCNFWNLETENNELMGMDGSELIIEGHHRNGYHMVYRWCGEEIGECGKYIIELSNIKIPERENY